MNTRDLIIAQQYYYLERQSNLPNNIETSNVRRRFRQETSMNDLPDFENTEIGEYVFFKDAQNPDEKIPNYVQTMNNYFNNAILVLNSLKQQFREINYSVNVQSLVNEKKSVSGGILLQKLVNDYRHTIEEFLGFIEDTYHYKESDEFRKYFNDLTRLIGSLARVYKIKYVSADAESSQYDNTRWGNLYWKFFHQTSILLQHAFANNLIDEFFKFSAILYNVEQILSCSICKYHYITTKTSEKTTKTMLRIIKKLSFGKVIYGTYLFHSFITRNIQLANDFEIDSSPINTVIREVSSSKQYKGFTYVDFVREWSCLPMAESNHQQKLYTSEYSNLPVSWCSSILCELAVLMAFNFDISFFQAINKIKSLNWMDISDKREFQETWNTYNEEGYNFELAFNMNSLLGSLTINLCTRLPLKSSRLYKVIEHVETSIRGDYERKHRIPEQVPVKNTNPNDATEDKLEYVESNFVETLTNFNKSLRAIKYFIRLKTSEMDNLSSHETLKSPFKFKEKKLKEIVDNDNYNLEWLWRETIIKRKNKIKNNQTSESADAAFLTTLPKLAYTPEILYSKYISDDESSDCEEYGEREMEERSQKRNKII